MERRVLVSGSTSGIGRATALAFARRGDVVIATARDPSGALAQSLQEEATGLALEIRKLDLAEGTSVKRLSREVDELDVLVNNAGFGIWSPLVYSTRQMARRQMEVNFVGLVDLTSRLIPQLERSETACIVNVGSIGSRIAFPLFGLYNASKFAVEAYSLVLRVELGHLGIRVVCVEPGYVESDFYGRSLDVAPALRESKESYYHGLSEQMDTFFHALEGSTAAEVSAAILAAADNPATPARILVGEDAHVLAALRAEHSDDDDFYRALLHQTEASGA